MRTIRSAGVFLLCVLISAPLFARQDDNWCGSRGVATTEYQMKLHDWHQRELARRPAEAIASGPAWGYDAGDIAVMQTNSRTLIQPNPFDLAGRKITFSPNPAGGYDVSVSAGAVTGAAGTQLLLRDDDGRRVGFTSGFLFPFYGKKYKAVFVNTDGNLTFKRRDIASTSRDIFRILAGPPRIAPFFHDLNPETAGTIRTIQTPTRFSVVWDQVSEWMDSGSNSNTFQVNLYKTGRIEFIYGHTVDTRAPIVGVSQGKTTFSNLLMVNFSSGTSLKGITRTLLERFATSQEVDYSAVINEFHASHPQVFDFVVIYTEFPLSLGGNAFAFFSNIKNDIKGIGLPLFNYSSTFGSPKIQGFLAMGSLGRYPEDVNQPINRGYSHLQIIGHETAHRWLAYPLVTVNGARTDDLLGYQGAHWNFYMDADASFMEGNDVVDNGNGSFTATSYAQRYSNLDLYLMGLFPASTIPSTFFVTGNSDKNDRVPVENNVTFWGTRFNVNPSQITDANGPRVPNNTKSQKTFRDAFVLLTKNNTASPAMVQKLDRLRVAFSAWFKQMTKNKAGIDTTLQ
jgi:hypothetical protein